MIKTFLLTALSFFSLVALAASPALAVSHGGNKSSTLGNDISWPQCGGSYPSGQAFGIVGVNGGLANDTNSCLSRQLSWAQSSSGAIAVQPKAQLYVNTANPGNLGVADWPTNNTDPSGMVTADPYGTCDGGDSSACAWQYGWNMAERDVNSRFVPAALSAGVNSSASGYIWWLDVETGNSWESGSGGLVRNAEDLQGMINYFSSVSATSGIYSTSYQWGQIAGTNNPSGVFSGLVSWIPGARRLSSAQSNCKLAPLTPQGKVTTAQFTSGGTDYDYSCI